MNKTGDYQRFDCSFYEKHALSGLMAHFDDDSGVGKFKGEIFLKFFEKWSHLNPLREYFVNKSLPEYFDNGYRSILAAIENIPDGAKVSVFFTFLTD